MKCYKPIALKDKKNGGIMTVPCGKCAACKSNRRESWSIRLYEQLVDIPISCFVTTTYNDENLTYAAEYPTLVKRDVQLFLKRLRKKTNKEIKFYGIGEYGTRTKRPHYHFIFYGINSDDIDRIDSSWGLGLVHVGKVTFSSIMYVCKYHVNKTNYPNGCLPPFALMSKRLGVGYLKRKRHFHRSIKNAYYPYFQYKKNLPRYYKDKLYNPIDRAVIAKQNIEIAMKKKNENEVKFKMNISSFFKSQQSSIENFERLYKEKTNFKEKL